MKSIFLILTKITLIGTLIIVLSILGFFAYSELNKRGAFMTKEEKYFYEKLREFKYSGKETVFLKELTNFEWDRVVFVKPYEGLLSDELNSFKLNKRVMSNDDGVGTLIFLDIKAKTGLVENFPRSLFEISFGFNDKSTSISVDNALLNIAEFELGKKFTEVSLCKKSQEEK